MRRYRRLGWSKPRVIACLVTLGIALLCAAVAQAAPQYDLDCDACHRMPPLDSASGLREPASGAVKGNHQSHAGASGASCVKCHGSELSSTAHRDKQIQLQPNLNGSPGAAYTRGFVNQTSVPPVPLGSCSNVNCHFETVSPTWGRTPNYDLATGCGQCHATVPESGNHPTAGSKHALYYGTGTGSCQKCHPDHLAEALPFRHATSAANRGIAVQFTASPASGGSYSGDGLNFLPSQHKTTFGSCAGLYCHSDGSGGAPNQAATWGGTLPADCSGCHGGNADTANPAHIIGTGSHARHINNASYQSGSNLGTNYRCARCHNATVGAGSDLVLTGLANHVDGSKQVAFSDGGSYSGSVCSGTACHAAGKASAPQPAPPVWGGSTLDCKGCHGMGSSFGEPNYPNAGGGLELANSHGAKHVSSAASCVNCHASSTGDGISIVNGSATHSDGSLTVSFPASYDLGGAAYDGAIGAKNCSNTYCHSDGNNGTPLEATPWGGRTSCRSCHGGDADSGSPVASYLHPAHLNNYSTLGRGNNLACAECHAKTMGFANNTTLTRPENHLNRFKDYSGGRGGGSAGYSNKVCSNLYCHSSGEAVPVFRNMTGSKAWDGSAKLGCNGCHGYGAGDFTPVAGEPNYANAGVNQPRANSHRMHTAGANMADSRGCAVCHRSTVDQGTPDKLKNYSSAHLNGAREVAFALIANYSGHYAAGNKSCSNTYCHGTGSVAWGAPGPLACTSCHQADASLAGLHGAHWEGGATATSYSATPGNLAGTATSYRFECSSCHNGTHANGPVASHNAAEVFFNYTAAGLKGSYSYGSTTLLDGTLQWSNGSCSATYCHSKGDGSEGFGSAAMTWGSPAQSLGCNGCHGGDFSKGNSIDSNLHKNHLDPGMSNSSLGAGNGRKCGDCHAQTVSFANNTTLIDKNRHVNKFLDYSGALAGGSANYDRNSRSCSDIYCHSNGKRDAALRQYRNPGPWTTAASPSCNGCHGQASPSDFSDLLGTPNYISAGVGVESSNSHKLHVQKMGITSSNACYVCHARTVDKYAAQKFRPYSTTHLSDGSTHVAFGAISSAGFKLMSSVSKARYSAKSCSTVACHSDGKGGYQDVKWGATSNCAMCHPLNRLSRGHAFHVYTSAANNPTFYDNYTANRSTNGALTRYNYGCANCHPVNNPNHTKGTVLIDLYPGSANVVGLLRSKNGPSITVGGVPAGTPGSGTVVAGNSLTCNNVYCHSNGYAGSPVYAIAPDWYNGSFSGDRCANCHGNWPNSSIAGSPSHYNNNWLNGGQAGGHAVGIHADKIANSANFTGLATPGTGEMSSHGNAAYSTTISCNTCHYKTVQSAANAGSSQCTSACHTMAANKASASIYDKSMHVTGRVEVSFQTGLIVKSKAQLRNESFATISSATQWHRNGTYKTAGTQPYDYSKRALSVGSYAGGNCSNVICHFNQPVPWTITPGSVSCDSCHKSL